MEKQQSIKHSIDQEVSSLLAVKIFGEFWINNSLFWVVYDEHGDSQSECALDDRLDQENNFCSVIGRIRVDRRDYLILEIKDVLMNTKYNPHNLLSERELQITTLVAQGKSNKEIASILQISEWTVATHIRRVFMKLNVDSRSAMVYYCASLIQFRLKNNYSWQA
ncbi:MAG: response regulator transcription factor [Waterburya sp.]